MLPSWILKILTFCSITTKWFCIIFAFFTNTTAVWISKSTQQYTRLNTSSNTSINLITVLQLVLKSTKWKLNVIYQTVTPANRRVVANFELQNLSEKSAGKIIASQ